MTDRIDPWGSLEIKNYEHVFREFGLNKFDTAKFPLKHRFFERNIVIAHRDFEKIYNCIKSKKPFVNMTGIATSGYFHFGHKVDIDMFKFFKESGGRNHFGICDIDAYTSRPDKNVESMKKAKEYAYDNVLDILALGMEEKDLFLQSKMPSQYYEFAFEISKKITPNTFRAIYGEIDLGKVSAVLLQVADILYPQLPHNDGTMPSITGVGVDQDPHIRLVRDVARRLPHKFDTACSIYFRHQSGLKEGTKMSSSKPETAIFLRDKPEAARKKIMSAFTGGAATVEIQKKTGGKPEICKVYEMMRYHHPDTKKLMQIYKDCKSGTLMCGDCKRICADFVTDFLKEHQKKREKAKSRADKFMSR